MYDSDNSLKKLKLFINDNKNIIVNHFINFILKWTEGGAAVDFIITLLTGHSD